MTLSMLYWCLWLFLLILGGVFGWQKNGWLCGGTLLLCALLFLLGVEAYGPLVKGG